VRLLVDRGAACQEENGWSPGQGSDPHSKSTFLVGLSLSYNWSWSGVQAISLVQA
jgi:hypothetical protein